MENVNMNEWTSFEKYLIGRIDKLEDKVVTSNSKMEDRITALRIQMAKVTVIIALATSAITATVVTKAKEAATRPARVAVII